MFFRFLSSVILIAASIACSAQVQVSKTMWGSDAGQPVELYTLRDADLTVRITTYGARVVSIDAPDRKGKPADVVLGTVFMLVSGMFAAFVCA